MLVLLLVAAVTTIGGVSSLVDGIRGTATQLRHESETVAVLNTDLVAHEETGHKLMSDEPVNRSAYLAQQQQISRLFVQAAAKFPTINNLRATIVETHRSWQRGLMTYGLWGPQGTSLHGNHAADNPLYGASSDATDALLAGIEAPSLDAMNRGLAHGADLEHVLIVALAALFGLALAVTGYFRRRMVTDLVRPVAGMHQGVLNLQAGDYEHRITVVRRDELGELAAAFNDMAGALHDSHLALTRQATHDALTGLPNRTSLTQRLAASFGAGADRRARHEGVLFIDVDDFKDVNDSLGHDGGDALLIELAARLNECVRPSDLVARLGGDEFAIVVTEDDGGSTSVDVAERILDAMQPPFIVAGRSLVVSVSIGVAQRRPDSGDAAELLRRSDFAMYMAKGGGKGRYQLFDAQVHDDMVGRSALKSDLAVAVSSGTSSVSSTSPWPTSAAGRSSVWRRWSAGSTRPWDCCPRRNSSAWPRKPVTSKPSAAGSSRRPPIRWPPGGPPWPTAPVSGWRSTCRSTNSRTPAAWPPSRRSCPTPPSSPTTSCSR